MISPDDRLDATPRGFIADTELADSNVASISEIEGAVTGLDEDIWETVLAWCDDAKADMTRILPPWDKLDDILRGRPEDRAVLCNACPEFAEFVSTDPIEEGDIGRTDVRAKVASVDPGYKTFIRKA